MSLDSDSGKVLFISIRPRAEATMRLGRISCSLLLLALGVLIPFTGDADATPFTILPNGDLVIETTYTTQGFFTCAFEFIPAPACSSGAGTNSVTFGSGANTAAVTFFGASATVPLSGSAGAIVSLGTIFASATPGFTFPLSHPQQFVVQLHLSLQQSSPAVGSAGELMSFGLGGGGTELGEGHFGCCLDLPIGSPPQPYHYGLLVYSPQLFTIPSNGIVDIESRLGAVPVPTTLLLFGTTMAGLGLAARWRRRRT
jgi:hypothetical protein